MGPPAKRRKLSPSDEVSNGLSEEESFEGFSASSDGEEGEEQESEVEQSDASDSGDGEDEPLEDRQRQPDHRVAQNVTKSRSTRMPNGSSNGLTSLTGEAHKSNIFKLQIDDLLEAVRPKYTVKDKSIERALRTLKGIIEDIPSRAPTSIGEAESTMRKRDSVVVPFPDPKPPKDAQYKLQYEPPAHINTVGSFPLQMGTKSGDSIILDLVVSMPPGIFTEKDYLNHRYFYKRAFYLACIAAGIKANKEQKYKLSFENLHGNPLLPILIVEVTRDTHPRHDLPCNHFKVIILPSRPESLFSKDKLHPSRNCVRPKDVVDKNSAIHETAPTPFYNASLSADGSVTSYLKLHYEASKQSEAYKDACVLGRIWLRQRGFNGRIQGGGFGNFEWATVVALLLRGGGAKGQPAFSSGYSSYQLFKATLQYLATRNLAKTPQDVGRSEGALSSDNGRPVLFDADRGLNVLYKMTSSSWSVLQYEAKASIAMLGDSTFDHFDEAFILRSDRPLLRYDAVVELSASSILKSEVLRGDSLQVKLAGFNEKLAEGLKDRVSLISVKPPEDSSWDIGNKAATENNGIVLVAFVLDPANAHRLIDHGPAAEDKIAASKFRKFWGDKAEMRRFRDGSILETVIWPAKDESSDSVFKRVVSFIIEKHVGKECAASMSYTGDVDGQLLPHLHSTAKSASNAPYQPMIEAFRTLEQDLRGLEDIPLTIRHVLASDSYLSYSSVDIPFVPYSTMSRPAETVLQFEGSARWPDDLDAIQRTKMAFFLKIAELLEAQPERFRARVGLENTDSPLLNQSFLDVSYIGDSRGTKTTGAAFRIRIHHDRELTLLERKLKDKSQSPPERQEVAQAIATYKRVFIKEPAHTQALQTMATRFPAYSGTARLLSRWVASHNLSNHISPFITSLIAARPFTNPYPWNAASSPQAGFYRALLFLSRWDWRNEPWIADLGSEMNAVDVANLNTRFEAWRKIDPALNRVVLFAGSNIDTEGTTWTDYGRPAKVVAGRLIGLAKAAFSAISAADGSDGSLSTFDPHMLFESSLSDYDFVIRLDTKHTRRARRRSSASRKEYKNLELQAEVNGNGTPGDEANGFAPAQLFLDDLEQIFGQAVLFFCNAQSNDVIAGLWNPACEERKWKLKLGYDALPVEDESGVKARLNKAGILAEIARLGGELIRTIDVKGVE